MKVYFLQKNPAMAASKPCTVSTKVAKAFKAFGRSIPEEDYQWDLLAVYMYDRGVPENVVDAIYGDEARLRDYLKQAGYNRPPAPTKEGFDGESDDEDGYEDALVERGLLYRTYIEGMKLYGVLVDLEQEVFATVPGKGMKYLNRLSFPQNAEQSKWLLRRLTEKHIDWRTLRLLKSQLKQGSQLYLSGELRSYYHERLRE